MFALRVLALATSGAALHTPQPPFLSRRALLAVAPAALSLAALPAAPRAARAASLTAELREAEEMLAASDSSTVVAAINRLLEVSSEYGGMPSDALRKDLVEKVRAKRGALKSSGGWDEGSYGEKEEQYLRLQRVVDPWRVVELQGFAQYAVIGFAPVYAGAPAPPPSTDFSNANSFLHCRTTSPAPLLILACPLCQLP